MAASVNDLFMKLGGASSLVNSPKVTSTRSGGGTTLAVDNCNWDQTTGKIFATYQVDTSSKVIAGTEIIWKGIVTGTTSIGSLSRIAGASDSGNAIGDIVELLPASAWANNLMSGILTQHAQDGTHTAVTSTSLTNVGAFTQTGTTSLNGSWDGWIGANESWAYASASTITVPTDATTKYDVGDYVKITQSAVVKYFVITAVSATVLTVSGMTPGSLETVANSAITSPAYSKARNPHSLPAGSVGVWKTWSPTYANVTVGNGTVIAKYAQEGKTVNFIFKLTWGSTTSFNASPPTITLPVASTTDYDSSTGQLGVAQALDNSAGTAFICFPLWQTTTTMKLIGLDVSNARYEFTSGAPFTWAVNDILYISGSYQAA